MERLQIRKNKKIQTCPRRHLPLRYFKRPLAVTRGGTCPTRLHPPPATLHLRIPPVANQGSDTSQKLTVQLDPECDEEMRKKYEEEGWIYIENDDK